MEFRGLEASGSGRRGDHRGLLSAQLVPNYLGVSRRFASSCTDFVVVDLLILDLVDSPHAEGGCVICLAKTRELGPPGRSVDQYDDRVSKGLCCTMV